MQNQPSQAREVKFCRLNLAPEFPVELMQGDNHARLAHGL